jgi:hypothetical protein
MEAAMVDTVGTEAAKLKGGLSRAVGCYGCDERQQSTKQRKKAPRPPKATHRQSLASRLSKSKRRQAKAKALKISFYSSAPPQSGTKKKAAKILYNNKNKNLYSRRHLALKLSKQGLKRYSNQKRFVPFRSPPTTPQCKEPNCRIEG